MRETLKDFFENSIRRLNFNFIYKVFLALILYLFLIFLFSKIYVSTANILKLGDTVSTPIVASKTLRYENKIETQKLKDKIVKTFKPVFEEKKSIATVSKNEVVGFFDFIEKSQQMNISTKMMYESFQNDFPYIFDVFMFNEIIRYEAENAYEQKVLFILDKLYSSGVIEKSILTSGVIRSIESNGIRVYRSDEFIVQEKTIDADTVYFWEDINENISGIIEKEFQFLRADKIDTLEVLVTTFLLPNLMYSDKETEKSMNELLNEIKPVYDIVKKVYTIVHTGENVTEDKLLIIQSIYSNVFTYNIRVLVGMALFLLLIFAIVAFTSIYYKNDFFIDTKKYTLLIFEMLFVFLIIHLTKTYFLTNDIISKYSIPFYLYTFLPFVVVINTMISGKAFSYFIIYTVTFLTTIIIGQANLISTLILFTASMASLLISEKINRRSQIYLLGLVIFLIYLLGNLILLIISDISLSSFLIATILAFFSSIIQVVLISLFLPLFEYALDTATVFKLQELADLNNPILRNLQKKAPGTYNHSISMGNLVEVIARDIGENPLLAKVSGYYHDIGKMENPLYFIENTTILDSRHKNLKPTLSASILKNHVKFGVEIAREYGLPEKIIDAIKEHHGTSIIRYFYALALKENVEVDKNLFQYAGPKPKSKITAIIMLIDSIEAASRALGEHTKENIRQLIKEIINAKILEGELNDSGLTLHDIDLIQKKAFQLIMVAFHERIAYPKIIEDEGSKKG